MKIKQIAILIPTYSPQEYIEKCFDSIDKQTISKDFFKVYIALNGQKEPYFEYLKNLLIKYNFENELIYIKEAGVSNARNRLIDISKEPFVTFIDDDDLISPSYLEELFNVSDEKFIGASNSYSFTRTIEILNENFIGKSFASLKQVETSKYKTRKYFSPPCAKLISREMIGNVRFDKKIAIGEDSLFMAELSNKVVGIRKTSPKACYYINEREGSTTRRKLNKLKEIKRIVYLLSRYIDMLFSNKYNKIFILTRIAATLKHHLWRVIVD